MVAANGTPSPENPVHGKSTFMTGTFLTLAAESPCQIPFRYQEAFSLYSCAGRAQKNRQARACLYTLWVVWMATVRSVYVVGLVVRGSSARTARVTNTFYKLLYIYRWRSSHARYAVGDDKAKQHAYRTNTLG